MKKQYKSRISALLMGLAMISSLMTGCAGDNASSVSESTGVTIDGSIRDISSMELVKEMKVGWNLGNTLDGGGEEVRGETPNTIEIAWGNPTTTKEMIDEVVKAGFNIIRVPVTWEWSTGDAPDYIISDAWMDRVQEVVDYAVANDVFVILNIHHETWHNPTEENYEAAKDRLKKIWTQIGTRFADYNEKLIFEGLNEPRVIGSREEWTGGTPDTREIVNKLNFDFVETIRGLGGNNALRHLMIPGYAASFTRSVLKYIKVPENDDKIIVSVHAYTPYNFALKSDGTDVWDVKEESHRVEIDRLAEDIKTLFVDNGTPVIIGEFGAVSRGNEFYRANWAKYFITKMKEVGTPCVWWDNGAFDTEGENFGLFNRRELYFRYSKVLEDIMTAVNTDIDLDLMIEQGR